MAMAWLGATSRLDLLEYFDGAPGHGALRKAMTELGFTNRLERPPLQLMLVHPLGKLDLFTSIPFPDGPTTYAEIGSCAQWRRRT